MNELCFSDLILDEVVSEDWKQQQIDKLRMIVWLECYIKRFKCPNWYSWFGFYEQRERVELAEKKLAQLRNS